MKNYTSTRNCNLHVSFTTAVLDGISKDGGLYAPTFLNNIKIDTKKLIGMSYFDIAKEILQHFVCDFTEKELERCIHDAYDSSFSTKDVIQCTPLKNNTLLELYHGPTSAFKDVALQILPQFMKIAKDKMKIKEKILILTATSGDTGKAALEGFKNIDGFGILTLYPYQLVSQTQEKQMNSTVGNNTFVSSVKGNFDDCQRMVKEIFNDKDYNNELLKKGISLSSANSINIGRLCPQVVYYFYAYAKLVENKEIKLNEQVNFVVPTGNFGNILAGYYAKRLGLPIRRLICASNENNVLTQFIQTGLYNRSRELFKTISPSMDIIISSNVERYLFELTHHDDQKVKEYMNELNINGNYQLNERELKQIQEDFYAQSCTDIETAHTIKKYFNTTTKVLDPHTAIAVKVCEDYQQETKDTTRNIILSTASCYKFSKDVYQAITNECLDNEIEATSCLIKLSNEPCPENIKNLDTLATRHHDKIKQNELKKYIDEKVEILLCLK